MEAEEPPAVPEEAQIEPALASASERLPVDNPFKPTKQPSSREVYYIVGPHPNGLKY